MMFDYQNHDDDIGAEPTYRYNFDGRSSASSVASTGSQDSSPCSHLMANCSRAILANTIQRNVSEQSSDTTCLDDSLTNLNWLYNVNPIKINEQLSNNFIIKYPKDKVPSSFYNNSRNRLNNILTQPIRTLTRSTETNNYNELHTSTIEQLNIDYKTNPTKPPFNYATLISLAMKDINKPKITLSDIYNWIQYNFAYYRYSDLSWQNSVRHNLSLGKCFEKVPRRKDEPGKGGFWRINPQYAKTLDNNLSKVKYKINKSKDVEFINNNTINHFQSNFNFDLPFGINNPVKKSRKSPLTVTPEYWDENDMRNSNITQIGNFRHNEDVKLELKNENNSLNSSGFSLDKSNEIELMDNFDPIQHLDEMLFDKSTSDNDDSTEPEEMSQQFNEFSDLFLNCRDSLLDLNSMLDLP